MPDVASDAGVVAMVYVEPPNTVVAIPAAPLEARVIASPPADVMMVAAWPPNAVTKLFSRRETSALSGYLHVTSENTEAANHMISAKIWGRCGRDLPPDVASVNTEPADFRVSGVVTGVQGRYSPPDVASVKIEPAITRESMHAPVDLAGRFAYLLKSRR